MYEYRHIFCPLLLRLFEFFLCKNKLHAQCTSKINVIYSHVVGSLLEYEKKNICGIGLVYRILHI